MVSLVSPVLSLLKGVRSLLKRPARDLRPQVRTPVGNKKAIKQLIAFITLGYRDFSNKRK
jgi:hypothetical protein